MLKDVIATSFWGIIIGPLSLWYFSNKIDTMLISWGLKYLALALPLYFGVKLLILFYRFRFFKRNNIILQGYIPCFRFESSHLVSKSIFNRIFISEEYLNQCVCFPGEDAFFFYSCEIELLNKRQVDSFDILFNLKPQLYKVSYSSIQFVRTSDEIKKENSALVWLKDKVINIFMKSIGIGLLYKQKSKRKSESFVYISFNDKDNEEKLIVLGIPKEVVEEISVNWMLFSPSWIEKITDYWGEAEEIHSVLSSDENKSHKIAKKITKDFEFILDNYNKVKTKQVTQLKMNLDNHRN